MYPFKGLPSSPLKALPVGTILFEDCAQICNQWLKKKTCRAMEPTNLPSWRRYLERCNALFCTPITRTCTCYWAAERHEQGDRHLML